MGAIIAQVKAQLDSLARPASPPHKPSPLPDEPGWRVRGWPVRSVCSPIAPRPFIGRMGFFLLLELLASPSKVEAMSSTANIRQGREYAKCEHEYKLDPEVQMWVCERCGRDLAFVNHREAHECGPDCEKHGETSGIG